MSSTELLQLAGRALQAGEKELVSAVPSKPPRPEAVTAKARSDYQTELDLRLEERISSVLLEARPNDGVVGEEQGIRSGSSGLVWYLDPLDGTRNLLSQRPDIALSLALYEGERPLLGIVSLPMRALRISAISGESEVRVNGATYRRRQASTEDLGRILVSVPGDLRKGGGEQVSGLVAALASKVEGVRISGALAYDLGSLILGEIDARISFACKDVDVAAASVLFACHDLPITSLDATPWRLGTSSVVAATSTFLHQRLVGILDSLGGGD